LTITEAFPDTEGGLRTFLRASTGVAALVGTRVFFGVPRDAPTFPLVTVARVGGGMRAAEEAPIDYALIQVDAWGRRWEDGGTKAEAFAVAQAVMTALSGIRGRTTLQAGTVAFDATVLALLWAPDPDTDQPRYSMTVEVVALAS
jgi:hypothetical protein